MANGISIDDENKIDDLDSVLLNIEENKIEKVTENSEKEDKSTGIEEYITKNKWQIYKAIVDIFIKRSDKDNGLKEKYSAILIIILVVQLALMNIIFILKGVNVLNFSDTTFNLYITATIAEVFTLVTIIVKYLFTDNLTRLLNNILIDENDKKN